MLSLSIPGFGDLRLVDLVSDFNGTLALDGRLLPGAADLIVALAFTWSPPTRAGARRASSTACP
jgi:hypothetical protein